MYDWSMSIGFGLTSDWSRKWREFFKPITKRITAKPKQTGIPFDSQKKSALSKVLQRSPALLSSYTLMGQYYKSLSVAATIMISNKCPILAEQVVVIFMTSLVTIAKV